MIALDGKVLPGAWTDTNAQVALFSAMIHDEAVVIAQTRVPDGTNEITQVAALLANVRAMPGRTIVTEERSHGRIRRWTVWVTDADGIEFPYAAQVAVIRREE